jgi:hypothetical protein
MSRQTLPRNSPHLDSRRMLCCSRQCKDLLLFRVALMLYGSRFVHTAVRRGCIVLQIWTIAVVHSTRAKCRPRSWIGCGCRTEGAECWWWWGRRTHIARRILRREVQQLDLESNQRPFSIRVQHEEKSYMTSVDLTWRAKFPRSGNIAGVVHGIVRIIWKVTVWDPGNGSIIGIIDEVTGLVQ